MLKKLLIFLLGLLLIIGIGSVIFLNLSGATTEGKKVDHTLGAIALFSAFETNEQAANKKYIGKIVEVKGNIMSTERDGNDATVILLDSGNGMDAILCTLEKGEEDKLTKGSEAVTIRGLCAGKAIDVVINKGIVVE